jgi:hypothetical protein
LSFQAEENQVLFPVQVVPVPVPELLDKIKAISIMLRFAAVNGNDFTLLQPQELYSKEGKQFWDIDQYVRSTLYY